MADRKLDGAEMPRLGPTRSYCGCCKREHLDFEVVDGICGDCYEECSFQRCNVTGTAK